MANFLRAAASSVVEREVAASSGKGTDLSWSGDRGWTVVTGSKKETPQDFETLVFEAYRRNPVVRSCMQVLTNSLAEAPVQAFQRGANGEWEHIQDHDAEKLFEHPNPRDSYVAFIARSVQHFFLGGNSFWRKRRNNWGFPMTLVPVRPDRVVSAEVDDDDIPEVFKIRRRNSLATERVLAEEIVHIPDVDPLNEVFGMPRLLSGLSAVQTDNKADAYVSEMLDNHGSPGLLIGVDKDTKPDRVIDAEDRFKKKFGPGRGRGKAGFVPGATMIREIGFSLSDLEFPDLRGVARESICGVLGVDPMLPGFGSASRGGTLSGTEHREARNKLWVQTLIPLIRIWEAVLNMSIAPAWGSNIYLFFELEEIEALHESRSERFARAEKMRNIGAYDYREIRAETGHDPEWDRESMILMPTGVSIVPASMLLEPPVPPAPPPMTDENTDSDGEDEDVDADQQRAEE